MGNLLSCVLLYHGQIASAQTQSCASLLVRKSLTTMTQVV